MGVLPVTGAAKSLQQRRILPGLYDQIRRDARTQFWPQACSWHYRYVFGQVCVSIFLRSVSFDILSSKFTVYMLSEKYAFAQSMDCAAQTMDPYFA